MARNPCKHPERRQEEMIPSGAVSVPGHEVWKWWWCKDCGAVQMRFTRDKDGNRICGGSKNLEHWRSPRMLRQEIDKTAEAHRMFLRAEMRVTLAVQAKNKLAQAITSLCSLTGPREHHDPAQCAEGVKTYIEKMLGWVARQGCENPSPDEIGYRGGVCGSCEPCEARDRLREAGLPVPFQCSLCGATKPCRHVSVEGEDDE